MKLTEEYSKPQMEYAQWMQQHSAPGLYFPLQSTTSSFSIVVGRLLCKDMRSILESEQFMGRKINWLESKGWFERLFTVTGEAEDVWKTAERITAWARNVNACDYR
jgi:hypothetical protein